MTTRREHRSYGLLGATKKCYRMLIDLESRFRRNNVQIFGVPEGEEGESTLKDLLKHELKPPECFNFQEGTETHRRGSPEAPYILFFFNSALKRVFLERFRIRKYRCGNRVLSINHNYTPEIVQRRKEYNAAKRVLKGKGIRFQTLFTRMRIHWENGT